MKLRMFISALLIFSSLLAQGQKTYPVLQTVYSTDCKNWEPVKTYKIMSKLFLDDTQFRLYNGDKLIGAISKGDCIVKKVSDRGVDYTSSTDDNTVQIVVRMYLEDDYTYTPIMVFVIYKLTPEDKSKVDYYRMNLDPGTVK